MRKRIKPGFLLVFFFAFILILISARQYKESVEDSQAGNTTSQQIQTQKKTTSPSSTEETVEIKPIVDISGWQMPEQIDYDLLANAISGAIVRVHSGAQAKEENTATHLNGMDKAYQKHIEELQKRGVPVAVYAYVAASSKKEMEKEAEEFYKASAPYNPTYYWLDVEEKTMSDMNSGIESFRSKLSSLGAKNIGIYIGTYFILEHSIKTNKFDAVWIPTYGTNTGYYESAPETDMDYDLHQYTSVGWIPGFENAVDLNQIAPNRDKTSTFKKLFGKKPSEVKITPQN